MTITVPRPALLAAVTTALKGTGKTTLPILETLLLSTEDGTLAVTGTDTELRVTERIPCAGAFRACVPGKEFKSILSAITEDEIALELSDATLTVRFKKGKKGFLTLPVFPAEDFPADPAPGASKAFDLDADLLSRHLPLLTTCCSADALRPAMMGIRVEPNQMVSTDGHRLAAVEIPTSQSADLVIPPKALSAVMQGDGETVDVRTSDGWAVLTCGSVEVAARLIEEQYPNWRAVMPAENNKVLTVSRKGLLAAVKRALLAASSMTHQIALTLSAEGVKVEAEDVERGKDFAEDVPGEYSGDELRIGVNGVYAQSLLETLHGDALVLRFSSPHRAILIRDEGSEALLMPVLLPEATYA